MPAPWGYTPTLPGHTLAVPDPDDTEHISPDVTPAATPPTLPVPPVPAASAARTPVPAPTPAPVPATAGDTVPAATAPTLTEATYRRRRVLFAVTTTVILVAAGWLVIPRDGETPNVATAVAAPAQAAAIPAGDVVAADIAAATRYAARHHTLTGYTPKPGGQVYIAVSGTTALFARDQDGSCWIYAIVDGKATGTSTDPSALACSPAGIDAARQQLAALG